MDECSTSVESTVEIGATSTATSTSSSPRNGTIKEECTQLQSLYDKYSIQQKEIERYLFLKDITFCGKYVVTLCLYRLEEQNAEYREKLLKTIRERDLNDELLRNVRDTHKKETSELEKRIRDYEIQLKAVQACSTSVTELKQQCDVLRKQLIQIKEEKAQVQEEHRQLSLKTQVQESRRQHESQELSKSQQDLEQRLAEANSHIARMGEANREVNARLEEVTRENLDLLTKLQDLEDKLSLEEEAHAAASVEVSRLQGIENQVLSCKKAAERAKAAQEQAEKEREVAEQEAEECRQQAERMLTITEQLTQRNSQLASDVSADREKNCRLEQQLVETEGSLQRALLKLAEREKDLEEATGSGQSEIESLKTELNEKIVKVKELTQRLQEERTDHAALKKKYMASIKELKHELSSLRKQVDANTGNAPLAPPPSGESVPSTSSRSRASSLNSLDRVTNASRDEESSQAGNAVPSESNAIQQVMIDK
ncbi:hypothetical protein ANCDUO_15694, partial [Ancylostoma duodenale]